MDVSKIIKEGEILLQTGKFQETLELVNRIEKATNLSDEDKISCNLLKSEAFYRLGNYQRVLALLQHILDECKKHGSQMHAFDALYLKSTILWRLGKFSETIDTIEEGEAILGKLPQMSTVQEKTIRAKFLYRRSTVHNALGERDRELEYAEESLHLFEEVRDTRGIANCLNIIAGVKAGKNELDKSLEYYNKALALNRENNDLPSVGMILVNMASVYIFSGELDKALSHTQESISIHESISNKNFLGIGLLTAGLLYLFQGKINKALEVLQQGLNIFKELNVKHPVAITLLVQGLVYIETGELNQALNNFQSSLDLFQELGITKSSYLSYCYRSIARVYHTKGNLAKALIFLEKSLTFDEDIGNDVFTSMSLYYMAKIKIDMDLLDEADEYIERLEKISNKTDNKVIKQYHRVIKAIKLKTSKRTIQKAEAQKILQDLSQEQLISLELAVEVLINLSDILLDELKVSGSKEILDEIKICIDKLLVHSENQHSYSLICETYLLQSKLALLELNTNYSQDLLSQAELIAEEKGLGKLSKQISKEKAGLQSIVRKFEKLITEKPSINEVIEITQLESLFEKMLSNRIYPKKEEVLNYLTEARSLVQSVEESKSKF